jgi:hypothetical protein
MDIAPTRLAVGKIASRRKPPVDLRHSVTLRKPHAVAMSLPWPKCLAFVGFLAQPSTELARYRVLLQNIALPFTTLEKTPFAVRIEPRPLLPKTGRASMMISVMRRSS